MKDARSEVGLNCPWELGEHQSQGGALEGACSTDRSPQCLCSEPPLWDRTSAFGEWRVEGVSL